jgi:carboxypeptidase Taq
MSSISPVWEQLTAHVRELDVLKGLEGIVSWDQQVFMPPGGVNHRGEQLAYIAKATHRRMADPRLGEWLAALRDATDELTDVQQAALRNLDREYQSSIRVPAALVGQLAEATAVGYGSWMKARQEGDYSLFAPSLTKLLELTRQRAEAIDSTRHPYDVLLDEFDPGVQLDQLRPLFDRLQEGLGELQGAVSSKPVPPKLDQPFDLGKQKTFHRDVVARLGYDFECGRLDAAEHPFTVSMGRKDVRITTHLYEYDLLRGLSGSIHEAGHGMYEQGLPDKSGTTIDWPASYGLHESQSRFWENNVGRSRPFCVWLEKRLKDHFPGIDCGADLLYGASNRVEAGLIRVNADEVTYNLHIAVRMKIEVALFEGRLTVADLPGAWNEAYKKTLGITPANDVDGVLQDVHWASGAFGYFPSYTLGNIYAASLGAAMEADLPEMWQHVESGDFEPLLIWLREKVHSPGFLLDTPQLVRRVVGERDMVADFLDYLWKRQGDVCGVHRGHE